MLSRVFVEIPTLHGLLCFQGRCETQIGAPGLAVDDDVRDAERFPTGLPWSDPGPPERESLSPGNLRNMRTPCSP